MNWKQEMKKMLIRMGEDFLFLFYLILALAFVLSYQSEEQFKQIVGFIFDKDWPMILVMFLGIACITVGIEKIFRLLFLIIKFFVKR